MEVLRPCQSRLHFEGRRPELGPSSARWPTTTRSRPKQRGLTRRGRKGARSNLTSWERGTRGDPPNRFGRLQAPRFRRATPLASTKQEGRPTLGGRQKEERPKTTNFGWKPIRTPLAPTGLRPPTLRNFRARRPQQPPRGNRQGTPTGFVCLHWGRRVSTKLQGSPPRHLGWRLPILGRSRTKPSRRESTRRRLRFGLHTLPLCPTSKLPKPRISTPPRPREIGPFHILSSSRQTSYFRLDATKPPVN